MAGLDREKLRNLIQRSGKTPRALSLEIGDNAYLIRDILGGKSLNPRMDTLQNVAAVLNVPLTALQMDGELEEVDGAAAVAHVTTDDPRQAQIVPKFLPVRYRVQAGHWLEVDEQVQDWEGPPNPVVPDRRYANYPQWLERVIGDSINLRIADGAFAHVVDAIEMSYTPRRGDLVVVERRRQGGLLRERTIKEVEIQASGLVQLWPRSTNPKWSEPMRITDCAGDRDDIEVQIVGLVLGSYASHVR